MPPAAASCARAKGTSAARAPARKMVRETGMAAISMLRMVEVVLALQCLDASRGDRPARPGRFPGRLPSRADASARAPPAPERSDRPPAQVRLREDPAQRAAAG